MGDSYAYDLEFYGLAIELDRPNFLVGLVSQLYFRSRCTVFKRHTKSTPIVEM